MEIIQVRKKILENRVCPTKVLLFWYTEGCWLFFKISAFILLKFRKLINVFTLNAFFKIDSVHKSKKFVSWSFFSPYHQPTLYSWVALFLFKGYAIDNNLTVK